MDIASAVYTIATGIVNFIAEHENREDLEKQLADVVIQLQTIISPLLLRKVSNPAITKSLQSLQLVLSSVDEHLRLWKESRRRRLYAWINPWAITGEFQEDRKRLMDQYQLLTGAMQIVHYIKGYTVTPSPKYDAPNQKPGPLIKKPSGSEIIDFWHAKIGDDMEVAKTSQICNYLSSWLDKRLGSVARHRLCLRLDEFETGHITLDTLKDFARTMTLKEAVRLYASDPQFPLLVWISDDLEANVSKVNYAQARGVSVVQVASTKSAQKWIRVNKFLLQTHDHPGDLRFVSDQNRHELSSKGKPYLNSHAGEEITKFIRKEGLRAPILILTSMMSLPSTRYVESYLMTGSANWYGSTYDYYVSALGARRRNDRRWIKYGSQ